MAKKKLSAFVNEFRNFVIREFNHEKYFCIVYGSYCYGLEAKDSDIDVLIVSEKLNARRIKSVSKKVIDLHKKLGLSIDAEVPHRIKTICDFQTLSLAIKGKCFEVKNKKMFIPPIIKDKKFLESKEVVMRLLLNSLTSKSFFVCGDRKLYHKKREECSETIIKVVFSVFSINSIKANNFVDMIISNGEKEGEDFLGYKNISVVRKYLMKSFFKTFESLVKDGKLIRKKDTFLVNNSGWFNDILF